MGKRNYDFAGWVTKNDIRCSDGVTIKHDAFKGNDGQQVPLVWNHNYNSPNNVLGHIVLHNQEQGVYGYGYFNETTEALNAKELVKHRDISSMSIGARRIKRAGDSVIHGEIYEVSLVMAGANPGAMIETVMAHSDNDDEKSIIYTDEIIHSAEDVLDIPEDDNTLEHNEKSTVEDIINAMSDEQKDAVFTLVEAVAEQHSNESKGEITHSNVDPTIGEVIETMSEIQQEAVYALIGMVSEQYENTNEDDKGDDETMKQNVFNKDQAGNNDTLKHSINEVLQLAQSTKASSLKDLLHAAEIKNEQGEVIQHGINSIEMLFPEAAVSTNGNVPILYKDPNTAYLRILNAVSKSPFSRVKTMVADLTEDEARAKGYIKGNMKKEEFFSLIKRVTTPTTVYKKQKIDRDDIIDITDFDVVAFMNVEMKMMLQEEIARALIVGDGRDFSSEDKINESNIRPIIGDHEFFTVQKNFSTVAAFIEVVIKAMAEYRGSGNPDMFIDPVLLADVKLLRDAEGRFLFGDIPTNQAIANRLGLGEIVPTTFMTGKGAVIVNLRDYQLGATKGGELTSFDDFDIDFNQYKYLIETRLSGALTLPKSAIHLVLGASAAVGADATSAGLTYGEREADKIVTP